MAKKTAISSTPRKAPSKPAAVSQPPAASMATKSTPAPDKNSEYVNVTYDMIAQRAYEIWKSQGGSEFDNWIKAERELRTVGMVA